MASPPGPPGDPGAVRITNCSAFYGDRLSAMREMLTGGEVDYLTGDYLAELTVLILGRDWMKHPEHGYAKTFLTQLEDCLGEARDRGVRIVANAGGLNPAGLADAIRDPATRLGLYVRVAHVDSDDLLARAAELGLGSPLTANAYLGAWGIVDCLGDGADVVVTGRVTNASVIVGAAAAHFGWEHSDYDRLAGAVVAGHVIECGVQATGGNYILLHRGVRPDPRGFPAGRGARRRLLGDHQAPGHRRAGQRRHRHRATAVRDHRRATPTPTSPRGWTPSSCPPTAPTGCASAACASRHRPPTRCR